MKSLHQLESSAREQRAQFDKTWEEIRSRAQLPAIAQETMGQLNLRRRGPPLVVAGAVASAAWLIKKYMGQKKTRSLRSYKNATLK